CMIHGPGNKGNLNLLYKIVKTGMPWPLGGFENERSFLGVGNLCYLIKEMINNTKLNSGVFNFSDDIPMSTNELIAVMSDALKQASRIWNLSPLLIKRLALIGDKLNLPLNSERLKKLTESYVVSNQK